jgi:hypothetical protein
MVPYSRGGKTVVRIPFPRLDALALFLPLVVILVAGNPWIAPPAHADITAEDIKGYLKGKFTGQVNKSGWGFVKDYALGQTPSAEMDILLNKASLAIQQKTEATPCLRATLGLARAFGRDLGRQKILKDFTEMLIGIAGDIVGVGATFTDHLARAGLKLAFDKTEGKIWDEADKAIRAAYSKGDPEYFRHRWGRGTGQICDVEAIAYWDKADERFMLLIKGNCYCAYTNPEKKYSFPADESAFWEAARIKSGEPPRDQSRIRTFEVLVYTNPGETYVKLGDDGKSLVLVPGEPTVHVTADCVCSIEGLDGDGLDGDGSDTEQSDEAGEGTPDRWETPLDTAACPKCKIKEVELRKAMADSSDTRDKIGEATTRIGDLEKLIRKAAGKVAEAKRKLAEHQKGEKAAFDKTSENYRRKRPNPMKPMNDWTIKERALRTDLREGEAAKAATEEKSLRDEKTGLEKRRSALEEKLEEIYKVVKALREELEACNATCKDPDDSGSVQFDKSYQDRLRDAINTRTNLRPERVPDTETSPVFDEEVNIRDKAKGKAHQRMLDAGRSRPKPKPVTTSVTEPGPTTTVTEPGPTTTVTEPGPTTTVTEPGPTTTVTEPGSSATMPRPEIETIYEEYNCHTVDGETTCVKISP